MLKVKILLQSLRLEVQFTVDCRTHVLIFIFIQLSEIIIHILEKNAR